MCIVNSYLVFLYGIGCQAMHSDLENSFFGLAFRSVPRFYGYLCVIGPSAAQCAASVCFYNRRRPELVCFNPILYWHSKAQNKCRDYGASQLGNTCLCRYETPRECPATVAPGGGSPLVFYATARAGTPLRFVILEASQNVLSLSIL